MLIRPVPEIANLQLGAAHPLALNGPAETVGSQVQVELLCTGIGSEATEGDVAPSWCGVAPAWVWCGVGVDVLLDAQVGEWTRVGFDLQRDRLFVDQSHTNAHDPALSSAYQTTAPLAKVGGNATKELNLTILVDGGLLESYANSRLVISSLLSPSFNGSSAAEARQARAFSHGAAAATCTARAWMLRPVKTDDDPQSARAPVLFWASYPVLPGETVILAGANFGPAPQIVVTPLSGSAVRQLSPAQVSNDSVMVSLPASLPLDAFNISVDGSEPLQVNAPDLW